MVSKEFSVAVVVSDGKKLARWFEESLGFKSSLEGHWVLIWPTGSTAKIHLCEGKPEAGNTGIAFYVKDAARLAKSMKAKGVRFTREVTKESWGTSGMFADPDGNEYWLMQGTGP
jgi:catechol 2,3-dioxygenase-like lactoylglutathione lyase family enzyme